MESNIQSSFIPQDVGRPTSSRRSSSGGIADLVLMFAILAFAAASALSVAVFLYDQYLNQNASDDLAILKQKEKNLQFEVIESWKRLDDRMLAANDILSKHIAPSVFFDILNRITAQTIRYNSLSFDASGPKLISLEMDGVGKSVNSVAFQADLLAKVGVFQTPIFSNLDHQPDGVHFHLSAFLDSSVINFEKLTTPISNQQTVPASTTQNAVQTPVPSAFDGTP